MPRPAPVTIEDTLREALAAIVRARDACPHAADLVHREVAMQEIVRAEMSVSRALHLIAGR